MATPGTEQWAFDTYGQPGAAQTIVAIDFNGRNVNVNKRCRRHFLRLADIFFENAPVYTSHIDDFLDDWGYNPRKIAGTNVWSNHAWGIALDIDATRNARNGGSYTESAVWQGARKAVLQAEKEGFRWGGRYSNPDEMHFESILTPTEQRLRYTRKGKPRVWYRRHLKLSK